MKRFFCAVVFAAVMLCCSAGFALETEFLVYEDFQSMENVPSGCDIKWLGENAVLQLRSEAAADFKKRFETITGIAHVEFDFMVEDSDDKAVLRPLALFSSNAVNAEERALFFQIDKHALIIRSKVGAAEKNNVVIEKINDGQWYNISLFIELEGKEIKVYVNHERVCAAEQLSALGSRVSGISMLQITANKAHDAEVTSKLYIDNIKLLEFENARLCELYEALSNLSEGERADRVIGGYSPKYKEYLNGALSEIRLRNDLPETELIDKNEKIWYAMLKSRYLNVLYFDDFNNYPSSGFLPFGYTGAAVEYMGGEYGKSMYFGQSGSSAKINIPDSEGESILEEFDVMGANNASVSSMVSFICDNDVIKLDMKDGKIWCDDLDIADCAAGAWIHLRAVFDFRHNRCTISSGDKSAEFTISSKAAKQLIFCNDSEAGAFYADNIGVSESMSGIDDETAADTFIEITDIVWIDKNNAQVEIPSSDSALSFVKIKNGYVDDAYIYAAVYSEDGKLKMCSKKNVKFNANKIEFNLDLHLLESTDYIKFFLFGKENQKPLSIPKPIYCKNAS